jgi:hypothetical protein
MQRLSTRPLPRCHLTRLNGATPGGSTTVWICEYPYRTMRASGPSPECEDCPIWQEYFNTERPAEEAEAPIERLTAPAVPA